MRLAHRDRTSFHHSLCFSACATGVSVIFLEKLNSALFAMSLPPPLLRAKEHAHCCCSGVSDSLSTTEIESHLETVKMEKAAHNPLSDGVSIVARESANLYAASPQPRPPCSLQTEILSEHCRCQELQGAVVLDGVLSSCEHEDVCSAEGRARMIERVEMAKHAQGSLQNVAEI